MPRTHRLVTLLVWTAAVGGTTAATAMADPGPASPGSSPSCAALAGPASDLGSLKTRVFGLLGSAGNATQGGALDAGSLIALYGQSQEVLHSLRDESGKLRDAADHVSEPDLHDSTISLADTMDEGADFAEQISNPVAPKPSGGDLTTRLADLSTRASSSLQRFGDSYQKACGVDLGLGGLAKGIGGLGGRQSQTTPTTIGPPTPTAPKPETAPPAPAAPTETPTPTTTAPSPQAASHAE